MTPKHDSDKTVPDALAETIIGFYKIEVIRASSVKSRSLEYRNCASHPKARDRIYSRFSSKFCPTLTHYVLKLVCAPIAIEGARSAHKVKGSGH